MNKKSILTIIIVITIMLFSSCSSKTSEINRSSTVLSNKLSDKSCNITSHNNNKNSKINIVIAAPVNVKKVISKTINNYVKPVKRINDNNKVIVIDPGHGGKVTSAVEPISPGSSIMKPKNTVGACGVSPRLAEYDLNLKVAFKLKNLLEDCGYKVIMTRTSNSKTISNIERAEIGNKINADLEIRIHADSSVNTSVSGASMLVPGNLGYAKNIYQQSRKYGETIFSEVLKSANMKSRGIIIRNDLTGFNWSKVPVVLIEMGFLSNPNEDKLLSTDTYQNKIASGLCQGINKALN